MTVKNPASQGHPLRRLLRRHPAVTAVNLAGKNIVVTGAGPGSIGETTAILLAQWGATVLATTRQGNAEDVRRLSRWLTTSSSTDSGRIDIAALDLTCCDSVARFGETCDRLFPDGLDVLINNAGIHLDLLSQWKAPLLTADDFEIHWRTNYLGTFDLTQRLLPGLLKRANSTHAARIVNVVSMLHKKGSNDYLFKPSPQYNSWQAYGQSKLALMHMTSEMQRRHEQDGLSSYCLHPGEVFSQVASKGLAGTGWVEIIRNFFAPIERMVMMNTFEGSQTTLLCATANDITGGGYYKNCGIAQPSSDALNTDVAHRLYDETKSWLASGN